MLPTAGMPVALHVGPKVIDSYDIGDVEFVQEKLAGPAYFIQVNKGVGSGRMWAAGVLDQDPALCLCLVVQYLLCAGKSVRVLQERSEQSSPPIWPLTELLRSLAPFSQFARLRWSWP